MKCRKACKILARKILALREAEKLTPWAGVRRLPQIGPTIIASLQQLFYMPEDKTIEITQKWHVLVKNTKAEVEMVHMDRREAMFPPPGDWDSHPRGRRTCSKFKAKNQKSWPERKRPKG